MVDQPQNRAEYDADAIVVGAGPIGPTAECAPGHHGVDVRVFEERTKPKPDPCPNNVSARGRELLESMDVRNPLVEQRYRVEKQIASLNGAMLDQVPLDQVKSSLSKVLYSGQHSMDGNVALRAPADRADRLAAYCERMFMCPVGTA